MSNFVNVELRLFEESSFTCRSIGNRLNLSINNGNLAFFRYSEIVHEINLRPNTSVLRLGLKTASLSLKKDKYGKDNLESEISSFDRRTDSWSAVQYFQFYSYLSQQQNMMQDYIRTSTYQRAILANASVDFRDKVVLDVGAGSGISFFAIQAGAIKVYAVELSNMARFCNTLVQANKLAGRIIVIGGKIEEITLPEPVSDEISNSSDVETSEEDNGEAMHLADGEIPPDGNIKRSNRALLSPGIMFPTVANLYIVPFSDDALFAEQFARAYVWYQQNFHGMDLTALRNAVLAEYFNQPIVDTFDIGLCPAVPCVHKVDFRTVTETQLASIDIPLHFQISTSSAIHGLAFWFDVGFLGSQRELWLSTAPTEPLTHWYQVRCLLGTPLFVQEGQILNGHVAMRANTRQSYDVRTELIVPGCQTKITNTLDLKNPHFRYNSYPPAPPPFSHNRSPTEVYYSNLCFQQQQQTQQQSLHANLAVPMTGNLSIPGGNTNLSTPGGPLFAIAPNGPNSAHAKMFALPNAAISNEQQSMQLSSQSLNPLIAPVTANSSILPSSQPPRIAPVACNPGLVSSVF
ncbi:unnamed protein product [Dicrocoelium dendriticum]|nr:unnamed protein product [Dicrocoelium dendriticum]